MYFCYYDWICEILNIEDLGKKKLLYVLILYIWCICNFVNIFYFFLGVYRIVDV